MAHLTLEERRNIEAGWNAGDSYAEIARRIGRTEATVRREILMHSPDGLRYQAADAHREAISRRGRRVGHPNDRKRYV